MSARHVLSLLLTYCVSAVALAQAYPNRPVRLIVPFPPGGAADLGARVLAQPLQEAWGQSVVVENRGGSSGIVASELAAKAPPDGYTLFLATDGPFVVNPFMFKNLPYDPVKDFIPISLVALVPSALFVTSELVPSNNLAEFVAFVKARPGQINYASAGIGSPHHLAMETLKAMAGIELSQISYKGGAPAVQDVLAGRVHAVFGGLSSMFTYMSAIKSGKLKVFAVSTAKRSSLAPELPTVAEQGYPGFEVNAWMAVVVPRGTARSITEQLERDVVRITQSPTFRERMAATGSEPVGSTGEELRAMIDREQARNNGLIRSLNIRPE